MTEKTEAPDDFDAAFAEVAAQAEKATEPPATTAEPTPTPEPTPAPTPTPEPTRTPEPTESPEAKAAREAPEASIPPYEPDETEKAALAQFEKDFPTEYAAMVAKFKAQDREINARVYKAVQAVLQEVRPRLATVESTAQAEAVSRHFNTLRSAHADYDEVITKIPAWIKTLPSYAQVGAQAVYDGGTTEEVLALVTDYKKAVGTTAAPASGGAAPAGGAAPSSGAADLAPVSSRRSTPTQRGAPDKQDYNGAWEELEAATK